MFFNRHIKQGTEAGKISSSLLQKCFSSPTSVIQNAEQQNPNFPEGLFKDFYIVGFFTIYIGYLMDWSFGGETWTPKRREEFIASAMNEMDPAGNLLGMYMSLYTPDGQNMLH